MTKFLVDLHLDGYGDDQAAHDLACEEFIKEALDFSASSVTVEKYKDEPTARVYNPPQELKILQGTSDAVADNDDKLLSLNTMLYVGGSKASYRCSCGSNVFSHYQEPDGREYYECHGCYTIYRGEK